VQGGIGGEDVWFYQRKKKPDHFDSVDENRVEKAATEKNIKVLIGGRAGPIKSTKKTKPKKAVAQGWPKHTKKGGKRRFGR